MPSEARKAAVRCLVRVEEGAYSNLVLSNELERMEDPREASFCTLLVTGTLSRLITIDHLLAPFLKKGIQGLDREVRAILRMSVYQLFWADSVPARAAVNEAVELCRVFRKSSAAGLVNAVLRKCSSAALPETDDVSIKYSVCPGLAGMLEEDYPGRSVGILEAMGRPARLFLRVNRLKWETNEALEALKAAGAEAAETEIPYCIEIKDGFRLCMPFINEGKLRVQSKAAQCAALAVEASEGCMVLDMCAAPGGKAADIAQDMGNTGSVTALDIYGGRLKAVESLADKEGISIIRTEKADAASFTSAGLFDRILCDVPCSGYGEISSKPELRYKDPSQSAELPALQLAILENAAGLLKTGGRLVYSTCTVLRRENEGVVSAFLERHPEFVRTEIRYKPAGAEGEDMLLLPGEDSTEGFFAAAMVKTGETK